MTASGARMLIASYSPYCGHTWIARSEYSDKIYSLRSLPDGSFLVVDGVEYPTLGKHSCHITVLQRQAVVSDYTSGTLSLFELNENGTPTGAVSVVSFEPDSHIHSSWKTPDGGSLVVVDLGVDCLYLCEIQGGKLKGLRRTFKLPSGSGPRHCAFSKDGCTLYVSTERSDEVLVYSWPEMKLLQRCLVNDERPGGGAHLDLSPDGKFLYVSSRLKNDGIAVFSVGQDGLIEKLQYTPTGLHPRHFSLSQDGSKLYCACRDSDRIDVFDIDRSTGLLSKSSEIAAEKPVFCAAEQPAMAGA